MRISTRLELPTVSIQNGRPICLVIGLPRIGLDEFDDRGDVARHRRRQALGDGLPVAFHEDEGDDRLQQHHRGDDDDQRTGVEAARHRQGYAAEETPQEEADGAHENAHAAPPHALARPFNPVFAEICRGHDARLPPASRGRPVPVRHSIDRR
jgi:hypothetical protein